MTQTSSEVLAEQNFLFVSKDTFLSQQKGLNGTELTECLHTFGWNS